MRQKLLLEIGNNNIKRKQNFINSLKSISFSKGIKVMIAPSYTQLSDAAEMLKDHEIDV